ncbi:hypothetical protein ACQCT6_10905 [Cytobacillus gottheilii]|uniref:hypothetical protein n=1 Tax=Cytobacillus gottheilii TaxID=859144 RepID=UPI003CF5DF76
MKHYSLDEWMKYVKNEVDDDTREMFEDHLYSCDQCLDLYLFAVEEAEDDLPVMGDELNFTDMVMSKVQNQSQAIIIPFPEQKKPEKKKTVHKTAIFHYAVAAAMTLLLMTTGVFQSLTQYAEGVKSTNFQEKKNSVTEGLVDKTFAWMDSLESNNKEEGK